MANPRIEKYFRLLEHQTVDLGQIKTVMGTASRDNNVVLIASSSGIFIRVTGEPKFVESAGNRCKEVLGAKELPRPPGGV